jgi:hypothetical protein
VARRLAWERVVKGAGDFQDVQDINCCGSAHQAIDAEFAANPGCAPANLTRVMGVHGHDTISYLERFNVSHAIVGASRLDQDGPSDFNSASVWIKRTMFKQAANAILVMDSNKFDQKAF